MCHHRKWPYLDNIAIVQSPCGTVLLERVVEHMGGQGTAILETFPYSGQALYMKTDDRTWAVPCKVAERRTLVEDWSCISGLLHTVVSLGEGWGLEHLGQWYGASPPSSAAAADGLRCADGPVIASI